MTTNFKPGDVARYTSTTGSHCREGMAIAEARDTDTPLFDTFWATTSGDRHLLTLKEMQSATVLFNLDDFERLPQYLIYTWAQHRSEDRQVVTHQHGLQRDLYIRKGAKPDHGTKVENAEAKVAEAEENLRSAESMLQYAREDLARLRAEVSA